MYFFSFPFLFSPKMYENKLQEKGSFTQKAVINRTFWTLEKVADVFRNSSVSKFPSSNCVPHPQLTLSVSASLQGKLRESSIQWRMRSSIQERQPPSTTWLLIFAVGLEKEETAAARSYVCQRETHGGTVHTLRLSKQK